MTSRTGAAACGWWAPERAVRSGATIAGIQPLIFTMVLLVLGEITSPSSSTGGLVAVAIGSALVLLISPLAIGAAVLAAKLRTAIVRR